MRAGSAADRPWVRSAADGGRGGAPSGDGVDVGPVGGVVLRQYVMPNSRAMSMRCTSEVPSPISRILESRQNLATGNSFMKP